MVICINLPRSICQAVCLWPARAQSKPYCVLGFGNNPLAWLCFRDWVVWGLLARSDSAVLCFLCHSGHIYKLWPRCLRCLLRIGSVTGVCDDMDTRRMNNPTKAHTISQREYTYATKWTGIIKFKKIKKPCRVNWLLLGIWRKFFLHARFYS